MSRRLASLAAAAAVAVLAGCGGGEDKSSTPLDEALGYLPENAPAVVVVETDPQHAQWKQVNDLISKFTIAPQIREQGKNRIAPEPLDFDRDLRPQLGNEVVVGIPQPRTDRKSFVAAVKVQDAGRARSELVPQLQKRGLQAQLDGEILVAATNRELLGGALEQAEGDGGLDEDQFEEDLGRLAAVAGGEPLVRATGDLQRALESDKAGAAARSLPWLGALRTFAAVGIARPEGLAVDFDVRTERTGAADLPLAPGPLSPPVPRRAGEIVIGVRDPARALGFQQRLKDVVPKGDRGRALAQALDRIDVDVQRDLIDKIGAVGAASFPLNGTHVARANLKDREGFARTLATIADRLPDAGGPDLGFRIEPGGGEGFYRITGERGRQLFIGVTGDQVAMGDESGRARDFAEERSAPVPGARGSVVMAADGQSVAAALIEERVGGPLALLGGIVTEPLGDARGWLETTPTGMTGHADLEIE